MLVISEADLQELEQITDRMVAVIDDEQKTARYNTVAEKLRRFDAWMTKQLTQEHQQAAQTVND